MDKIRSRLQVPKAQTWNECASLIIRDSLYLAWPVASLGEDIRETRRRQLRKVDAIDEEDEYDDG
ncbi:hypothetical protein ACJMK2_038996, partial [Sinanodonta woodiana]